MKLIGAIAFLTVIFVGCQKEDIRPNPVSPVQELRGMSGSGNTEDTINGGDTDNEGAPDGSGIQDDGTGGRGSGRTTIKPRP